MLKVMIRLSAFAAFGAGLLSFLSPCVLPLIPSWLFFIGGAALGPDSDGAGSGKTHRGIIFIRTVFFTLGFSAVFISTSIVFSSLILFSGFRYMDIAAGIIIIAFGLNVIFGFLKFLNYEKRLQPGGSAKAGIAGLGGAFLVGAAFGAGWTPCVGPVLASILLMAGQSGRLALSALYLALYSAGLALPFLAAALFFDRFLKLSEKIKKRLPLIQKISGVLLVIIGILVLSGRFQALVVLLQGLSAGLQL